MDSLQRDPNHLEYGKTGAWQYSILGADNAELAVWRGYIMSEPSIPAVQSDSNGQKNAVNAYYLDSSGFAQNIADTCRRSVFMFPEEYSVPLGCSERIYFKNTQDGGDNWEASLSLTNHLGTDYSEDLDPFGNGTTPIRQGFIGCNKDAESGYGDHGVRKYDPEIGRFTCVEPLIDKYSSWSAYQYCFNNSILFQDGSGLAGTLTINASGSGKMGGHAWISYTPDGSSTTTTYGTWGNNPLGKGDGLFENIEKNRHMVGEAVRSMYIDDSQESSLFSTIDRYKALGDDGWSYTSPCSTFAQEAWLSGTGEYLPTNTWIFLSNPETLKESIWEANNGVLFYN